ncbi:MAG: Ketoisovalerate oxidoreductase subunit VorA [Methanomassiliicoccales archaeon PtaU1.Bin124]|nr:MAG: Ketoisovalerate oxidoreductase subunit VorA [Methanomassiliicoccales archaeon PtaU1.Bin124]
MIKSAQGFYETFERREPGTKATHFCPGCGHGIIHKLIAEAIADLGLQDRAVFVSPVGCAAFCYYYFDTGNVAGPHGRASAVATGISRALPDKVVIAYQGDGDLGAIGFNNAFQAANRGEKFACFFVNNSIFAMTGGQMAPTTLPGQKTTTTPFGRDVVKAGYPLKISEVFNQLEAPVYIERVSVADTKRIMQAKKAVRKALEIQRDGKGYAFVEFLSQCPTNWRMDALQAADFVTNEMEKVFPLGCLRDRSDMPAPAPKPIPQKTLGDLFHSSGNGKEAKLDESFREKKFKFSGFGGQGILSLGLVIAEAAGSAGRFVSWFPSYGPEQRGGSASCSVVISGREVGSPTVDNPDVLVAMNQPSLEKFLPTVRPGGTLVYEASIPLTMPVPSGVKVYAFPAMKVAAENGVPKAANTALLGALTALGLHGLPEPEILAALDASFAAKPALVEKNRKVYKAAFAWAKENLG